MKIQKDLTELVEAGVITQETADGISEYYEGQRGSSTGRLLVIFGILGALLVGLGIILILAHNWDDLTRAAKTVIAFIPLVFGQLLCGYVLLRQPGSSAWREGSSTFLVFAVGASISLVSQIYNIPGDLASFVLTWSLLCLPLVYVMQSSMTSLLYWIGITYYAAETGYWSHPTSVPYFYWALLLAAIPHYYHLIREKPGSNFTIFHHWFVPLSLVCALGTLAASHEEAMFVAYCSLFGIFYLVGEGSFFASQKFMSNGYRMLGTLGQIFILLMLSFDDFWQTLREDFSFNELLGTSEWWAASLLSMAGMGLLYLRFRDKWDQINLQSITFLVFIVIFLLGSTFTVAVVLINLLVLALSILTIIDGLRREHLRRMNYGLLMITALITCRFFDTDLSFVLRGLLFMAVGAGFFVANYWMLKKRREGHE